MRTRPLLHALLPALLAMLPLLPAAAGEPPPPVASFFENATFVGARLSPGGHFLAARAGGPGKRDFLVVINLDNHQPKVVAAYNDADIGKFQWVNDERLVYDVTDKSVGPGDSRYGPGLYAVNRDGSGQVQLAERRNAFVSAAPSMAARKLLPWHTFVLERQQPRDSDYVYADSPVFDTGWKMRYVNLLHLNTVTGKAETVHRPAAVQAWMLDQAGEPRLAVGTEHDKTTLWYREPASGEWRVLTSYPPTPRDARPSPRWASAPTARCTWPRAATATPPPSTPSTSRAARSTPSH